MKDGVKKFFSKITSFFKMHGREYFIVCHVFLFVCCISLSLFVLASCRGTWSLSNKTKVNGVTTDTHIEYTDGSCESYENIEGVEND